MYEGLNILLVDDSSIDQLLINELLSKKGATVTIAGNGKEALAKLKNVHVDFIIMDLNMPIMDGYETIKYIKSEMGSESANIPFLILSGYNIDSISKEKREFFGENYLVKPFGFDDLFGKINKSLHLEDGTKKNRNEEMSQQEESTIDLASLMNMTANNMELIRDTLVNMLEQLPNDMHILKASFEEEDYELLSTCSHKMSPNMLLIGQKDLSSALRTIENSIDKNSGLDEVSSLVEKVIKEESRLIKELSIEITRIREITN